MSGKLRLSMLALGIMACGHAIAADYDPPVFVEEAPAEEYVPVEVGSGWYLRGDIGYAFKADIGDVRYRTFSAAPPPGSYGSASFDSAELDKEFTFSGGVGYRFTDFLRADATVENFRGDFSGSTSSAQPCIDPASDPAFAGTGCRTNDSSAYSAWSIMANGYVDLGTYVGLTPYLGAGLGYSHVRWSDLRNSAFCTGATCPTSTEIFNSSHSGEKSWRLTYALMAGAAYDISKNLKLDLGYKYKRIDGGDMFGFDAPSRFAGARGVQGTEDGFSTHEVKVGLRYELW